MKGKKCIKFLTFFITLVLSFVLFSNDTNAINYISTTSWTSAEWTYYPGAISQNQTMAQIFFISNLTMTVNNSQKYSLFGRGKGTSICLSCII